MVLTWIAAIVALCLVFIVYASYVVTPDDKNGSKNTEGAEKGEAPKEPVKGEEPDAVPDTSLPESVSPSFLPIPSRRSEQPDEAGEAGSIEPGSRDEDSPDAEKKQAEVTVSVTADYLTIQEIPPETLQNLELITSNLPELPRVAMQLLPMLAQPGVGAKEIAAIIEKDQTTAARLLRWVNSSFYGLESKVESLHRAVTLLGMDTVRSAVLQGAFEKHTANIRIEGLAGNTIWRHASAVSIISKDFARKVRGVESDVAATAGLLHDIGLLLMLVMEKRGLEEASRAAAENLEPLIAHEDIAIGFNHQVMGECFTRSWRLPDIIAEAIGKHHTPLKDGFDPLAGVIWLADYVASRLDFPCPLYQVMTAREEELDEFLKLLGLRPPLNSHVTDSLLKQIVANTHFWATETKGVDAEIGAV
jgi:HD-like signal output (HDOD) protein